MAFLVVSGITVNVTNASKQEQEIGDKARAFDGTYRSTIRTRKRTWTIQTAPIARATADTLETALKSTTLPLVCSGDLLGATVNCFPDLSNWEATKQSSTAHLVGVSFSLMEV